MDKITRVGVDLAKNVMQIDAVGVNERVVTRTAILREHFVSWFARLEPCLVAMEACSTVDDPLSWTRSGFHFFRPASQQPSERQCPRR
ncbi:hypothetical protein [Burkholderia cepacia]|uniref:hypothetical protein n=1 Tax=Burkholderia cepacia TaxID=292 RepID=UPI0012DA3874|nr:hypothetical protein [Burkholderia cepacia]